MNQRGNEVTISEFTISIDFITLAVKFPCKMYLKHKNEKVSSEVKPNFRSQFIFNQKMTIKDNIFKGQFEFTINLTTEKERNIIAGLLKICNHDIVNSQGQTINFGLYNCLDQKAKCQIKVIQVRKEKIKKQLRRLKTISFHESEQLAQQKQFIKSSSNMDLMENYMIQPIANLQKFNQPPNKCFLKKIESFYEIDQLQNNLSLDITKYKLRIESLELSNQQKQKQINRLNEEHDKLKTTVRSNKYFTDEIENKNKLLQTYQGYFQQLRKENLDLINKNIKLERNIVCSEDNRKFQEEKLKNQLEIEKATFIKSLNQAKQELQSLHFQALNKNDKIQKIRKTLDQHERKSLQAKNHYENFIKEKQEKYSYQLRLIQKQLRDAESALREKELSNKKLKKQMNLLHNKLKKQQVILSMKNEEINLLKQDASSYNDQLKVKLAEVNRSKSIMEIHFIQAEERYKMLKQKQDERQQEYTLLETNIFELRRENQMEKWKNIQLMKMVEHMHNKLQNKENNQQKSDQIVSQLQNEINYKYNNEEYWREMIEDKNHKYDKIINRYELIGQYKDKLCAQQMTRIRDLHDKDKQIIKLNAKIQLIGSLNPKQSEELQQTPCKIQYFNEQDTQDYSPNINKTSNQLFKYVQLGVNKQIMLKNLTVNHQEKYLTKQINQTLNIIQLQEPFQIMIEKMQQDINNNSKIIESNKDLNSNLENRTNCYGSEAFEYIESKRDDQLLIQQLKQCLIEKEKKIDRLVQNQRDYQRLMESYQNNSSQLNKLFSDLSPIIVKISQDSSQEQNSVISFKINEIKQQIKLNQIEKIYIKKSKEEKSRLIQNNEIIMAECKSFNSSSFLNQFNPVDYQLKEKSKLPLQIIHKFTENIHKFTEKEEQFGDYINSIFKKQSPHFYKNIKYPFPEGQNISLLQKQGNKQMKCLYFDEIINSCPAIKQIINNLNIEIQDEKEIKFQDKISVMVSSLNVQKILFYLNNVITQLQQKCIQSQGQSEKYRHVQKYQQKQKKEDDKSIKSNILNDDQKVDISQAIQNEKLLNLESENDKLKFHLQEIMHDYCFRIDAITKLKDKLTFLENNITQMQIQQQKHRTQRAKIQQKIREKDHELINMKSQIVKFQERIEQILFYYTNQMGNKNNDLEFERKNHLQNKNKYLEQILILKNTINQLQYEKKKMQEVNRLNKLLLQDSSMCSDMQNNEILIKSRSQEKEDSKQNNETILGNNKTFQLQNHDDKSNLQIKQIKAAYNQEIQSMKRTYNSTLLQKSQKIIQLQRIIDEIMSLQSQKKPSRLNPNNNQSLKSIIKPLIKNCEQILQPKTFSPHGKRKTQSNIKQYHNLASKDLKLLQMIEKEYKEKKMKKQGKKQSEMSQLNESITNQFITKQQMEKAKSFLPAAQDYNITLSPRDRRKDILIENHQTKNVNKISHDK